MRKCRLKLLVKSAVALPRGLGLQDEGHGLPSKGSQAEEGEPLGLSNIVTLLSQVKPKTVPPVDISVTEAKVFFFLMPI